SRVTIVTRKARTDSTGCGPRRSHRMHASCTTSSASVALPSMRYAMPKSSERHSSNVAVSASRSGNCVWACAEITHRDGARVGEALTTKAETGIEARAKVLESNPGRELDELGVAQMGPDASGQLVGYLTWASGRHLGVLEYGPLPVVEEVARPPTF